MKHRYFRSLLCSIFIVAVLSSCGGAPIPIPGLATATPILPSPTAYQQALPPQLVETDPPLNTVIGQNSPITFYFNEPMNKSSVESSLQGLPEGTFTWDDEATLVFNPTQSYTPNSKLNLVLANSIQSANGFGLTQPIDEISFAVADYLRPTNILPKEDASDVDVESAIAVSFNQPVVPLGADNSSLPAAFSLQPSAQGRSEWINTSTYIFYPEPALAGGTDYTIKLNPDLKTEAGVGLEEGATSEWKFSTASPRVVTLEPASDQRLPLDPQIQITFNQPMDTTSVESNFTFSGVEGKVKGTFEWNEDETVLTFVPDKELVRNVGYTLNIGTLAKSKGGMALTEDYGAILNTFDNFAVTSTNVDYYSAFFTFSSPLAAGDYDKFVKVSPPIDNFSTGLTDDGLTLGIYGNFQPETNYEIELDAKLRDRWGQSLGDPFRFNFRTAPAPATLNVDLYSSSTAFVRPDEPALYAKAVNIQSADVTVAPITLQEYLQLQNYENQQAFSPANALVYPHTFNLPASQTQDVKLRLAQQGSQLLPGLYYVGIASPQITTIPKSVYFAASSHVNLTFKLGATEALVWAVDLPSQTPLANVPVTIYDDAGNQLASGNTDENGLWRGAVASHEGQLFAMLSAPGDDNFALATSSWNMGVSAWDFGYSLNAQPPHTEIYMYTDRPMYRPGQTVYFRGVARQAFNGRYELPQITEVPILLRDANGTQLLSLNEPLSPYGTFNGEYQLSENAAPGYYTFENTSLNLYFTFQVAEYRKPEIDLSVDFSADEIQQGDAAQAKVNARYFFGAPANNVEVHWAWYAKPAFFYLSNYETNLVDTSWLDLFRNGTPNSSDYFGSLIEDGTGQTSPNGLLSIEMPAIPEAETGQIVTLEVSAVDESGLPVSARAQMTVHPADFYIGIHPDQSIGRADSPIGFDVFTVDWNQKPSGDQKLSAEFKQVRWEKQTDPTGFVTFEPVYTPVSGSSLTTAPDGKARLSFVPPSAGTYMLEVSGEGARTQSIVWISGAGAAAWPDLPNQRVELTADKDSYQAGDTAKIFIPNPFAVNAIALVTVERATISKAEVIQIAGSGREYSLLLTEAEAPNVYVSVTILGQGNDFRQGLVNLSVAPDDKALNVQVTPNPSQAGPRDEVTFDVQITDNQGQPVESEFSLSVVDLASLALTDPNAADILPAYYSIQPLGIETGLSIAAYSGRDAFPPGGMGGGGGGEVPFIREDFPDTAYWNPSLITNSEGRGQVTMTLPDSLTTWRVDVRGVTVDTKVGQADTEIVSTKPLLIRPVTPRFLVNGDHVLMAAIVDNNTSNPLTVSVNLQSDGFILDDPNQSTQEVKVPANGRTRLEWWGSAGFADSADLVFSAATSGTPALQDSARPVWGALPILQYTSPQAFVTGGVLRGAASQQEVISLPRTFMPKSGGLDVEVSSSLAGSLLSVLAAIEEPNPSSAESILSYFLPNLEVYQTLSGAGLNDPALTDRVAASVDSSVHSLLQLQNEDGGWNWWGSVPMGEQTTPSDPYVSAYVFFGLVRAHAVGVSVDENALQRAGLYLSGLKREITNDTPGAELDEFAFIQFALAHASTFDEQTLNNLYNARERLSPASKALLAYSIHALNPADERVRDLISNLEASAIVTASGAHWETPDVNIVGRGSPIYTTSLVVYVLSKLDAANQVLFNAVRYLAAHRNAHGLWGMGHDNAWALLALNEAMLGFGDLNADFTFDATFNGGPLLNGDVTGAQVLTPAQAHVPLEYLSSTSPNLLTIQRADGLGRLYYRTVLNVNRPVEEVQPLNAGMRIERVYCKADSGKGCSPLSTLQLDSDQTITAQLTLVLPHDAHYVMVEDYIPAGMEILNRNLKTSQQANDTTEVDIQFDDKDPFAEGWGWWLFHEPQIRDDSILFTADYLPAGTYVLTYTLVPLQAGSYRVLPAHAWEAFFPEVQGTSAGALFEIKP